ncbi:MAG TPA: cache domain-containing protein [Vineibacter sp.]|nr:cache domain-containing protein [Vineibacter sp.]
MARQLFGGLRTTWSNLRVAPGRAPLSLERLAAVCLRAPADDSRLGDLSERYVRTHQGVNQRLGDDAWAMVASHLAADLRYLAGLTNVALFARAVDPSVRLVENGTASLVALDLRERTMTLLRVAAGKLVLPALLLVGSALLVGCAIDVWTTWRQTEALMARLHREKAEAVATRIELFVTDIKQQVGWTTAAQWAVAPIEQRRFDYIRLLRQVAAITELAQVNGDGKEVLQVSRLAMDKIDSGTDYSGDVRFTEAQARGTYLGPVYFRKRTEPYMSIAIARTGRNSGATLAEVNLKTLWGLIDTIKIGEAGFAYIVDRQGRLIAHRDADLALRMTDVSTVPQVAAALSAPPTGELVEGRSVEGGHAAASMVSVHAVVPTLGWRVFVDLPAAEARAPLWNALFRGLGLLALALVAALLASLLAARRATSAQPAQA